jgi:hypothetical protein
LKPRFQVVRRVALLGGGEAARRGLLQTRGGSSSGGLRDYDAWLGSSLMGMVGFALVVITLLCVICLFSIDIKQVWDPAPPV